MIRQPLNAPVADLPRCARIVCGEHVQAVGADLRVRTAWPANRKRRAKQTGRQVRLLANLDLSGLAITLKWGPSKGPVIPGSRA